MARGNTPTAPHVLLRSAFVTCESCVAPCTHHVPHTHAQDRINELCTRYGASCISQRDALMEGFREGWLGFSPIEVAGDCLHPTHGTLGTEFVTDLLVEWSRRAREEYRSILYSSIRSDQAIGGSNSSSNGLETGTEATEQAHFVHARATLPRPLWGQDGSSKIGRAACFTLREPDARGGHNALRWHTASCAANGTAPQRAHKSGSPPHRAVEPAMSISEALGVDEMKIGAGPRAEPAEKNVDAAFARCVRPAPRSEVGPSTMPARCQHDASTMPAVGPSTMPFWMHCLVFNGKPSPAATALSPGATLLIPLPTDWLPAAPRPEREGSNANAERTISTGAYETDSDEAPVIAFNVTLQYLRSWRDVGQVSLMCVGSCECARQVIDGYVVDPERNATVFGEFTFPVNYRPITLLRPAFAPLCALRLRVREETTSGGHLFRVRDVIAFVAASPCHTPGVPQHFLAVRNGLHCAT